MSLYGIAWREGGTIVRGSLLRGARAGEWLLRGLGAGTLAPSAESLRDTHPAEEYERWVQAYDRERERVQGMPLASLYGLSAAPSSPPWTVLRATATARGWSSNALHGMRLMADQGATPGLPALLRWDESRRAWLSVRLASPGPVAPPAPPGGTPPGETPPGETPPGSGSGKLLGTIVVVGILVFVGRTILDPRATRWGV